MCVCIITRSSLASARPTPQHTPREFTYRLSLSFWSERPKSGSFLEKNPLVSLLCHCLEWRLLWVLIATVGVEVEHLGVDELAQRLLRDVGLLEVEGEAALLPGVLGRVSRARTIMIRVSMMRVVGRVGIMCGESACA